jgi:hypothetical protein
MDALVTIACLEEKMTGVNNVAGFFVVSMVGLLVTTPVTAARNGPPAPTVYPVTSTVFDGDVAGTALQLQADDLFTPGPGSATYRQAVDAVVSQIDTSGGIDWNLDLRNSTRGFYLTITAANGGSVAGLPVGAMFYSGRVVSRCFTPAGGTTAFSWFNIAGADPNCAMRVNITSGSKDYSLVMSPLYPGTGVAEVYCNAVSGGACVDWTVLPNPNVANAGIANLYSIAKSGAEKFVAACKLSFRIHVTYP